MSNKNLLEELLGSARDLAVKGRDLAEDRLNLPESGPERDAMLSGMGKGAAVAGVLALLLGTGPGRGLTGTALKLGSLAAVGGVAYKVYQNWKNDRGGVADDSVMPIDQLDESDAEARAMLLVRAMVAAARADGHIDAEEQHSIEQQISGAGLDADEERLLRAEINVPASAEDIAAQVSSQEEAAEVYLVSRLIIDPDNRTERLYLDELIKALDMDYSMVADLEARLED